LAAALPVVKIIFIELGIPADEFKTGILDL
jgi:hypothetical protein